MTESLTTTTTAPVPLSPVVEWHAHLDLQVRAGQMAKDTATTYRQGMRKLTEWASQQESWDRIWGLLDFEDWRRWSNRRLA